MGTVQAPVLGMVQAQLGPYTSWALQMDLGNLFGGRSLQVTGSLTTRGTSDLLSAKGAPPPAQLTSQTDSKAAQIPGEQCLLIAPKAAVHKYHVSLCSAPSSFSNHCLGSALHSPGNKARSRPLTAHAPPPSIPGLGPSRSQNLAGGALQSPSHMQSGLGRTDSRPVLLPEFNTGSAPA